MFFSKETLSVGVEIINLLFSQGTIGAITFFVVSYLIFSIVRDENPSLIPNIQII
jgi:hypothetical protein